MPQTSAPAAASNMWVWIGIIIVVVVVASVVLGLLRKRLLGRSGDAAEGGFTLHDIRTLREAGRLSEEEYQRARAMILGRAAHAPQARDPNAPRVRPDGALEAAPGRDLTGAPLPPAPPGSPRRKLEDE